MSDKELTIHEILVDRLGKVKETEQHQSSNCLLLMFPNNYSISIQFRKSRKAAVVNIYHKVANITPMYFPKSTNKHVVQAAFIALAESLENEEIDDSL